MPNLKRLINQLELFKVAPNVPLKPRRPRRIRDAPKGQAYDLDVFFRILSERYLWNRIERPVLRWSRNRWRVVLGICDFESRVITINRALDDARIPDIVIASTLFHELLHLHFGITEGKNGRHRIHPPEFKRAEKSLPGYQEAEIWLNEHFPLRGRPAKKPREHAKSFLELHATLNQGEGEEMIPFYPSACGGT